MQHKQQYVIIINGIGGVGKDTLCDFAAKHFPVRNISSITPIKDIARMAGWKGEKDAAARKLLSDLKQIFTAYNDLPLQYVLREYAAFRASEDRILFVHIREPEEIERLLERLQSMPDLPDLTGCTCLTLLIRRQQVAGRRWGNASDDLTEDYAYDHIYHNDKPLEEAEGDFVDFISEITGISGRK